MLRWFIVFTLAFALIGWANPLLRKLGLGRLPGDIHIQRGNWTFYFPLATSIVVSLVLTLVFWLIVAPAPIVPVATGLPTL